MIITLKKILSIYILLLFYYLYIKYYHHRSVVNLIEIQILIQRYNGIIKLVYHILAHKEPENPLQNVPQNKLNFS